VVYGKADTALLRSVVASAAEDCVVGDLADAAEAAWPVLADCQRFVASLDNVKRYIDKYGVDEHLASLLTAKGQIAVGEGSDEAVKQAVALAILGAQQELPAPEQRARLAGSLHLAHHIDATAIPDEAGHLIGHLLAEGLVADDAETFAKLAECDWAGREFAIQHSDAFASFMTPVEVPVHLVGRLMNSQGVPATVKDVVVGRFGEFTAGASQQSLEPVAQYAVSAGRRLPLADVVRLAQEGVRPQLVLFLTVPHLPDMNLSDIASIVMPLGENYRKLVEQNGKRPRVPNTEANRALVSRLQGLGVVSSVEPAGSDMQVRMRRGR
jgi:hypothetical protein